jgi:hypothetical protein
VSDYPIAVLAGGAYSTHPAGAVFDYQHLRAVVTERDGVSTVAIRGTVPTSLVDWERDVDAVCETSTNWPELGPCHRGFLEGAQGIFALLAPALAGNRVVVTGHSLGGAVAVLLAAILVVWGTPPELLVTWEAPKAGGEKLRKLLARVPVRQYRYGNDPVTELPWLPGVYEHVRLPLISIGKASFNSISCHDIAGIIAWEASCSSTTPPLPLQSSSRASHRPHTAVLRGCGRLATDRPMTTACKVIRR